MKIIIVGINSWYIYHFWKPLLIALKEKGYVITIISELDSFTPKLIDNGYHVITMNFYKQSINPLKNIISLINLLYLYKKISPDVVHHFNPKPVIFGSIVARLLNIPYVINNYPGLGNLFRKDKLKFRMIYFITKFLYKIINSSKNIISIFQVKDDIDNFNEKKLIGKSINYLIRSSGVNLDIFKFRNEFNTEKKLQVGMIARLNADKGLDIYLDIAKKLENFNIKFILVGQIDNTITKSKFELICADSNVEYLGFIKNIDSIMKNLDVVILPTRRFEGIPKILIEAASTGATVISSNLGGCKDIVINEENGYILESKNLANQIADKLIIIESKRKLLKFFGANGRKKVEKNFNIELVISQYLQVYNSLLK